MTRLAFLLPLLCLVTLLPALGQANLGIVERSDYHRSVGSAKLGLVYRESRAYLHASEARGGAWEGRVFVLEEVYSDAAISSRKVERSLDLALDVSGMARASGTADASGAGEVGFPTYRNFLAGAPPVLSPGQTWISQAALALDPANTGDPLVLPVLVEYRVSGAASYAGLPVTVVKARFALRYEGRSQASDLRSASGSHDLDLYVDASRGGPAGGLVFLRDRFDDSYGLASSTERHTGFTLVFYKGTGGTGRAGDIALLSGGQAQGQSFASPAPDPSLSSAGTGPLLAEGESALDETTGLPPSPELAKAGVDLLSSPEGLVLRVKDLPFVADKADILPGEAWRLDVVAASLARLPGRSFLVEGHSAGVGKPGGELELSVQRAKRVVDELVARGMAASRFVYRGLGSTRPLAANDSEAGRARNRRVEITILE